MQLCRPGGGQVAERDLFAEARRVMEVCNACRYCEGFCAVFPAMERRRSFTDMDLDFLAHLCHGCRGCYYACQYASPHPFAINVPQCFSELRLASYARHAWPKPCAALFHRNGIVVAVAMGISVALVVLATAAMQAPGAGLGAHPESFYAIIPQAAMVWLTLATCAFSVLAVAMAVRDFWRHAGAPPGVAGALAAAVGQALTLRNLGGGGHGCNDRDERFSTLRRRLHHALFYGLALCFAATCVAAMFDWLGYPAPYAFWSAPVLLGTAGGLLMLCGSSGMVWLRLSGDPAPTAPRLVGPNVALLALLALLPLTGLFLLALRDTAAMGFALAVHLGFVLALFIMAPYSRLVHGAFRVAALLLHWRETNGTRQQAPTRFPGTAESEEQA